MTAHVIRNASSQMAKAIFSLEAQSRWAVTATPVQNHLSDLTSLLQFLRIHPYSNSKAFETDIVKPWRSGNELEAMRRLKSLFRCISLRRGTYGIQLPRKTETICLLDFSIDEQALYDRCRAKSVHSIDFALKVREQHPGRYLNVLQRIDALRRICNHGTHGSGLRNWPRDESEVFPWSSELAQESFDSMLGLGNPVCSSCAVEIDTSFDVQQIPAKDPLGELQMSRCLRLFCIRCVTRYKANPAHLDCGHLPACPTAAITIRKEGSSVTTSNLVQGEALPSKVRALIDHLEKTTQGEKRYYLMILITNTKLTTHSVVFSCWTSTLDLITSALRLRSIGHARIDGAVAMNKRQSTIASFEEDPTVNILLLTLTSGTLWCVETQNN